MAGQFVTKALSSPFRYGADRVSAGGLSQNQLRGRVMAIVWGFHIPLVPSLMSM